MSLLDYLKENNIDQKEEVIFFGGSFNPWHEGHESCLRLCPDKDKLIVIPDHNPFKDLTEFNNKTSLSELKDRISSISSDINVFVDFATQNKKNPTNQWIKVLKENINIKLSLLMGFDTFLSIHTWIEAESLLNNLSRLYIVDRLNDKAKKDEQVQKLKDFDHLELVFLGGHQFEHLSSTDLRNKT